MPDEWIGCEKCGLEIRESYRETHEKKEHSSEPYASPFHAIRSTVPENVVVEDPEKVSIDARHGRRIKKTFVCQRCPATVTRGWVFAIIELVPSGLYYEKVGELFL